METVRIGIFMADRIFAKAMATGLARECRSMTFQILYDPDDGQELDMVLTAGDEKGTNIVQMVRDPADVSVSVPPYRVYRYRESQNLVRELLQIYFHMTGRILPYSGDRKCRLIVFAAGGGGWGVTSTAISVCRMLYRIYGSRCLYLNLCPIDDSKKYLNSTGNTDLLKLLYYLEQEREFPLEAFITAAEELDYVDTRIVNYSCDELNTELLERFLSKVEAMGVYDFVVADTGNHLNRQNRHMLGHADITAEVLRNGAAARGKYFSSIAREIEKLAHQSRLIRIETFARVWQEEQDDDILTVSEDREVFRAAEEQELALELSGNYGMEIGAVARRIMEDTEHERA